MSRKISLGSALALAILFGAMVAVITMLYGSNSYNSMMFNLKERENMYAKLAEIDRLVRNNYYGDIDENTLNDYLARGYVAGIGDEYGMYLTAEEYQRLMASYEGQSANVGIEVMQEASGYMQVLAVYPDSPAESRGIRVGDLIVKVEDVALSVETFSEAAALLQGESGTTVNLTVRREGEESTVEITRRRVEVPSVEYRVIDHVGYIRIKEFNDNTPSQFRRALDRLTAQEVTALCFDVRDNPGGTLDSVCEILDILLPAGDIVSATYKTGETVVLAMSDQSEIDMPMAVLINSRSASSAELFAQALKDYNKARAVGTTTYGKGMMQSIYMLSDGSALDITVAHYNPPKSDNYEGVGVKPDYEVRLNAEQDRDVFSLDEFSDPQLRKALELLGVSDIDTGEDIWIMDDDELGILDDGEDDPDGEAGDAPDEESGDGEADDDQ